MARSLDSKPSADQARTAAAPANGASRATAKAALESTILVGESGAPSAPSTIVRQSKRTSPKPLLQDLAVSRALEINCDCLRQVGLPHMDSEPPMHLPALSNCVEQLLALWQLMSRRLGRQQARQSAARMRALIDLLPTDGEIGLVTQELLDNADDRKTRAALRQLMDEWSNLLLNPAPSARRGLPREALSRLLQRDSAAWRHAFDAQPITDAVLLKRGFGRTYRRARKLSSQNMQRKTGLKRLRRWRRRVVQVVGQLELLDSVLSDANRETLWHLSRLQRVLQQRIRLRRFVELLETGQDQAGGPLAKAYLRGLKAANARDKVLERRARKLSIVGFKRKGRTYTRAIAADSANIRL